ncbi:MAG: transposase [Chloroflexota bacterium]|jgi:transposase|nr:transposase [Chloroflexota bacterium]
MAKKTYTLVFKDDACKLVTEQGYSPGKAGGELGVAEMTLRSWLKSRGWRGPQQSMAPDASEDPKVLQAHIRDLSKKLRQAEMEKEILKKATAFFASQP